MSNPDCDCRLCPRLVDYRDSNRLTEPSWHNAPAPPFGDRNGRLLIVGLAPGRTGANRTGRVFTGDAAGRMLFQTLIATGLASGTYREDGRDDIKLHDCLITNAVLCAPPGNRPLPSEETTCRPYLTAIIKNMPRLKVIVTLGDVARRNLLKALGKPASAMTGGHGSTAVFGDVTVISSFHCSRLNLNTGRLTPTMFATIFAQARTYA
ncbi:uracil-DNA glycosylase [Asticcacaulis sp. AC402]|uniref:uracil-DNA glycosylase n=1 Tax=Asticcacaulis sp. AC402 TaxID=1282361 RepID=UPI0003C3C6CE|nr:uracil-DNA glycosylase [Asticcacaulis sp. AC402]ESQ76294.1 uracil-DNA glycosylase [Asticcacaulis sp. AC402]